ncbi:MAG: response regulator transcription factor [Planctomycetales bacterium]|nr:response regulator transcription factor [Planctomycetales bacterium]
MPTLTTLIVDDHSVFRQTLRRLVETCDWLRVVGEAADGVEALEQVAALAPQLVVMDIQMPHLSGLDAGQIIKQSQPATKIVLYSGHDPETFRGRWVTSGDAFLEKQRLFDDLLTTIQQLTDTAELGGGD